MRTGNLLKKKFYNLLNITGIWLLSHKSSQKVRCKRCTKPIRENKLQIDKLYLCCFMTCFSLVLFFFCEYLCTRYCWARSSSPSSLNQCFGEQTLSADYIKSVRGFVMLKDKDGTNKKKKKSKIILFSLAVYTN